jgi:hypothetical protein
MALLLRELLDLGAQPLQLIRGCAHGSVHIFLRARMGESFLENAEPQTIHILGERLAIRLDPHLLLAIVGGRRTVGVFAMQHAPGAENAFGGVAQAYSESVPLLVLSRGYPRRISHVGSNFNSVLNMRNVAKLSESITAGAEIPNIFRRAFSRGSGG